LISSRLSGELSTTKILIPSAGIRGETSEMEEIGACGRDAACCSAPMNCPIWAMNASGSTGRGVRGGLVFALCVATRLHTIDAPAGAAAHDRGGHVRMADLVDVPSPLPLLVEEPLSSRPGGTYPALQINSLFIVLAEYENSASAFFAANPTTDRLA
jgi:hypothetical protein